MVGAAGLTNAVGSNTSSTGTTTGASATGASTDQILVNRIRRIASTPYKILDAPNLCDDFYLNLVDWSSSNVLAVALA